MLNSFSILRNCYNCRYYYSCSKINELEDEVCIDYEVSDDYIQLLSDSFSYRVFFEYEKAKKSNYRLS